MSKTELPKMKWTPVEGEEHLYLREYWNKHGHYSYNYYADFTDSKHIRRRIPLARILKTARRKLGKLLTQRDADYDFDLPKRERLEVQKRKLRGIRFEQFGEDYFNGKISAPLVHGRPKRQSTRDWEKTMFKNLLPFFGEMSL